MRRGLLLAILIATCVAAPARGHLFLGADASVERGYVKLYAVGSTDLGPITYGEDGPLGTLALDHPIGVDPQLGPLAAGSVFRAATLALRSPRPSLLGRRHPCRRDR